jgi:hypothetical protein
MSFRDFLLNDLAPAWRKYGVYVAVVLVAVGALAIAFFTQSHNSILPEGTLTSGSFDGGIPDAKD